MVIDSFRQMLRSWRHTPVLALTAVLTLSLGVGVNAAVFSVVHAVLFRPLPYPEPDQLVELFERGPRDTTGPGWRASALNYRSWAEHSRAFDALAAFNGVSFNLTGEGDAQRIPGAAVTATLYRVLGLGPIAGRELSPADEQTGAPRVAVIAQSLWQGSFGGDPSAVGRTVMLNGERYEIVGIVADAFREVGRTQMSGGQGAQIFVPLIIDATRESRGNHVLRVVGRLRPDASLDLARHEMSRIAGALGREFPATNEGWGVNVVPIHDSMLDVGIRPALLALLAAVGALMLLACANVSSLALAKALQRGRELSLRAALGATRGRLLRQLLAENLWLALVSGTIGIWVSVLTVSIVGAWLPRRLPRIDEVRVDLEVLAFGLAITLGSGMLFGILPALRGSRLGVAAAVIYRGRGVHSDSHRLRQGLVAAQVALATMLFLGAALFLQSFGRLTQVPLGFDSAGVFTARVSPSSPSYAAPGQLRLFYQRLLESVEGAPHVEAAAIATSIPFGPGVRASAPLATRTGTAVPARTVVEHVVSDQYFRTLAIPIVAGRTFDHRDRAASTPVAIVSQLTAHQLWPDTNPVGQTVDRGGVVHEVIGIVGDVRGADGRAATGGGLDRQPQGAIYLSAAQLPQRQMTVVLRTIGDPSAALPALRGAVGAIDPSLPVDAPRTLDSWLEETVAYPRLAAILAGVFAAVALLLAAIGVYGVVAHAAGQRASEIGLRVALGATRHQVLALIIRGGVATAAAGVAAGTLGALLGGRAIASLLFGVQADDPATFGAVAILLASIALTAAYLPARRAASSDPMTVLRSD